MTQRAAPTALKGAALAVVVVVALVGALAGCSAWDDVAVDRVVTCAGPDAEHPAGIPVRLSLRQGGREVASAESQYGQLVALLVPSAPTAVFADGTAIGTVSFGGDGGDHDPASGPAPDEATIRAAAATDPSTVEGYIGITGLGCPDPHLLGLD